MSALIIETTVAVQFNKCWAMTSLVSNEITSHLSCLSYIFNEKEDNTSPIRLSHQLSLHTPSIPPRKWHPVNTVSLVRPHIPTEKAGERVACQKQPNTPHVAGSVIPKSSPWSRSACLLLCLCSFNYCEKIAKYKVFRQSQLNYRVFQSICEEMDAYENINFYCRETVTVSTETISFYGPVV